MASGRRLILPVADCRRCGWGRRHLRPVERQRAHVGLAAAQNRRTRSSTLVVAVSRLGHPLSVEVLRAVGLHLPPFVEGWKVSVAD